MMCLFFPITLNWNIQIHIPYFMHLYVLLYKIFLKIMQSTILYSSLSSSHISSKWIHKPNVVFYVDVVWNWVFHYICSFFIVFDNFKWFAKNKFTIFSPFTRLKKKLGYLSFKTQKSVKIAILCPHLPFLCWRIMVSNLYVHVNKDRTF